MESSHKHSLAGEAMAEKGNPKTMPIAIIGMSCRFPGEASSPERFWQLLAEGRNAWSKIPKERFNQNAFYHPLNERLGTSNVAGAHFLSEDVTTFDASFFNITSDVANSMDPQLRMQLELTYEALENAGLPLHQIAGSKTSVFAGAFCRDNHDSQIRDPDTIPRYFLIGNGSAMFANRISHFFDLRGPSATVDTGCSTSHTALHMACQSLRTGDASVSIVGGANLMLNPDMFVVLSNLGFLGPEGRSFAFDDRASGYARGEGIATIVLKPLEDALRDNDPIRAVIRETGLNQDGKTSTITAPNQDAQVDLMQECYVNAGLDPLKTGFVEAHGTGTPTGDPIEAGAISSVFSKPRQADHPLLIGSVKSNIGHLEAASGLASVIKVVMAFEKGMVPPNYDFRKANPKIPLESWRLQVPRSLSEWPSDVLRRASINSFGYGGTNGHVILEDAAYTQQQKLVSNNTVNGYTNGHTNGDTPHDQQRWRTFKLSAKDQGTTASMASNLIQYLASVPGRDETQFLDSLAYTLGQRRSTFPWTLAVPAKSRESLAEALKDPTLKPLRSTETPKIGFVFTGQGAQWYAMGRELIEQYPVFKTALFDAQRSLRNLGASWNLVDELSKDEQSSLINKPEMSLPLCTAIQIALVRLLESWGIRPTAVTGHSSGEVAAAYTAGGIDLHSAMAIVYMRGALANKSGETKSDAVRVPGTMMAVGLGREEADTYISSLKSGKVVVACVNSPSSVTISGDRPAILELEETLKAKNIFARKLMVEAAYHSHHMQPMSKAYTAALQDKMTGKGNISDIVYTSPMTGKRVHTAASLTPEHWNKNMLQPVEFLSSFSEMLSDAATEGSPLDMLVEIGPHSALAGPIKQILKSPEFQHLTIPYGSCLVRNVDAVQSVQTLICQLLSNGYPLNLAPINFPHGQAGVAVLRDLPSYPWNHKNRYWLEPRVNAAHRQRSRPAHDLLGSMALGSNPVAPRWRHIIRADDVPWVRDHLVQSSIVYPGAGYICMAIEAANEVASSNGRTVVGFKLRDIEIMKALVVPEGSTGVEVELSFRDCGEDKGLSSKTWQEFHVYSIAHGNSWISHCRGFIAVDLSNASDSATWAETPTDPTRKELLNQSRYNKAANPNKLFESMRAVGIHHGPIFQNLESIRTNASQSITTFHIADTAALLPYKWEMPHVLHPTTLDSIFQSAYSVLPGLGGKQSSAMVPQTIKAIYVANRTPTAAGERLDAYSTLHDHSREGFSSSIITTAHHGVSNQPYVEVTNLYCQSLGDAGAHEKIAGEGKLCSAMHWSEDLPSMQPAVLKETLKFRPVADEVQHTKDMAKASYLYIHDVLETITAADIKNFLHHQVIFYDWMRRVQKRAALNLLGTRSSEWHLLDHSERQELYDRVGKSSINGEMVCRVGHSLIPILRQQIAPLQLMMENKLLYKYYEEAMRMPRNYIQVKKLVQHFAHKNPQGKVLEIGGGTGGCTRSVLEALSGPGGPGSERFASYDFTDISSGFFEAAREKFHAWRDLIRYKKLDIESEPQEQGFELGSYDLIVACQVLHATSSIEKTMSNVRRLLKPGGTLVMVETTRDSLDISIIFGALPGWWLSVEDYRIDSPSLTVEKWQMVLQKCGFTGVDLEVHDCEDEEHYAMSVIKSTAGGVRNEFDTNVALVSPTSASPVKWVSELTKSITALTGAKTQHFTLDDLHPEGKTCVFLGEIDGSLLDRLTESQFKALRTMFTTAKGIFWVTRGASVKCENPRSALITGLLRTLRCEDAGKRYITLDLDPKREAWTSLDAEAITTVYSQAFNLGLEQEGLDYEYAERNGTVQIPRAFEDLAENDAVADQPLELIPELQSFYQPDRELRLEIGTPGLLDTLLFRDDPEALLSLPDDFVEIEPRAFGMNFRDLMAAMGQLADTELGAECSGIVTKVGRNVPANLRVGDRVCALTRGHYSNFIRLHWSSVGQIPDAMSFEVAASVPVVYMTAYAALYDFAHLQEGETVLIHAASGGVGQAAIALSQLAGAEIFATVSTQEKRDFVHDTYGIPYDHIFSSRSASFAENIKIMTKGQGVDVVINSLAGPLLEETWRCMARFGRFAEIGKKDLEVNNRIEMAPFRRCVTFGTIDLIQMAVYKTKETARLMENVLSLLGKNEIRPVTPLTVYPLQDIEKAMRTMQAGMHRGKIVIKPSQQDQVKVAPLRRSIKFRSDASYMVVGGIGGIGKAVARHLVERQVKNLILTSRSADSQAAYEFVKELEVSGCKVVAKSCDVSNPADLSRVVDECAKDMPPVRGVIQGAMVLKDSIFEQMSFADYLTALKPKVEGSWNLHKQFGSSLDFFVMLSSFTGVGGNSSQSNYAAGGTFQDALARYRASQGLPAATIDLGMVTSVGYVAETEGVAERLTKMGYKPLGEDEVLRIIESAMANPIREPAHSQIITGIPTGPGADWARAPWRNDPRFRGLRQALSTHTEVGPSEATAVDLKALLQSAPSEDDAVDGTCLGIIHKLAEMFMIPEAEIDRTGALEKYGVDSLVAVELRNWLVASAGIDISIFEVMQSQTIALLAQTVVQRSTRA